jgi:hypothetical protein
MHDQPSYLFQKSWHACFIVLHLCFTYAKNLYKHISKLNSASVPISSLINIITSFQKKILLLYLDVLYIPQQYFLSFLCHLQLAVLLIMIYLTKRYSAPVTTDHRGHQTGGILRQGSHGAATTTTPTFLP